MDRLSAVWGYLRVGSPDWAVRRRMAISAQALAAWMIFYGGTREATSAMGQTLVTNGVTLTSLIITAYIAAAVVDDHLKRKEDGTPGGN